MNLKRDAFLILSIILAFPNYSNSYDIYKIMGWKFGVINPSHIILELITKKMLKRNELDVNFVYEITDLGKNNVNEYFKINEIEIYEEFKKEEFLNIFFNKLKEILKPDGSDMST